MSVAIVILTYNRSLQLQKLLQSLQQLSYSHLDIVVVDNNSTDDTENMVAAEFNNVVYIKSQTNIGVAARNIGLRYAKRDIVITLDDDVLGITDEDIGTLLNEFSTTPTLGAVCFKILDGDTNTLMNWTHHRDPQQYADKDFATYELTEGAVAFRTEALSKAGYYPENFVISHEGIDLAFRILEAGYEVIYSGQITVRHYHSTGGRARWEGYYYNTRNLFLVARRNFPLVYSIFYLLRGLTPLWFYSIRDGFHRYFIKGVLDGLRELRKCAEDRKVLSKKTMARIRKSVAHEFSIGNLVYLIKNRVLVNLKLAGRSGYRL